MTSESTRAKGTAHTARPWVAWQDGINVLLGLYLFVSPLLISDLPNAWFQTLGILAIAVAIWALTTSASTASESAQIVVGIVLFLAPWLGGFAAVTIAAWHAWIIGVALIVFAIAGMTMRRPRPSPRTAVT